MTTGRGTFTRQADEALGSRIVPLDDAGLEAKFIELVEPVLGKARANELVKQLWDIETVGDIAAVAQRLHVHPNTVRYRVRRIEKLLSTSLDDPDDRLVLALGLRATER